MKKLIKILFLMIILTRFGFTQWYHQISGVNGDVTSIIFLNESKGFATSGFTYLSTNDGGSNWIAYSGSFDNYYTEVYFVSEYVGWLLERHIWQNQAYRSVINTTNGGSNWYTSLNQMSPWHLYSLHFFDENVGWVVGTIGTILKTSDNLHWEYQTSNTQSYLNSVFFIDSLNGWSVGDPTINSGSNIIKTTDGGSNWLPQAQLTNHSLRTVFFKDINNGWIAGDYAMLFKTTNSGVSWAFQVTGIDTNYLNGFKEIFFVDANNGWIVGRNGIILNSYDGGQSWHTQESGTNTDLNCVFFIDEFIGWAAGNDGTILHTTNGGISGVENEATLISEFNLQQNYPNPFNPSTVIGYQLPLTSNVTLKVFDVLGNEIATLVNEEKPVGKYEIEFNSVSKIRNPASGIYFCRLQTKNYSKTIKMLYLK